MTASEFVEIATGTTVWAGLIYLSIQTLRATYGTRVERTDDQNWRDLFAHLKSLQDSYTRNVERMIEVL